MTGLVRRATLLTVAGLMAAGAASAGVPNAGNTSRPGGVILASKETAASPGTVIQSSLTLHTITVRDAANSPVPNSVVVITMAGCTASNEIELSSNQPHAGVFVNCAAKSVSAVTNASGIATFRLLGRIPVGAHPGHTAGVATGCATMSADGVALGSINVAVGDVEGVNGINNSDFSRFLGDRDCVNTSAGCGFVASPKNQARSDYNGVNGVENADGSIALGLRDYSGTDASEGADCP